LKIKDLNIKGELRRGNKQKWEGKRESLCVGEHIVLWEYIGCIYEGNIMEPILNICRKFFKYFKVRGGGEMKE
jgi:hypothetical protein